MDIRSREGLIRFLNRLEGSVGDEFKFDKEDIRSMILLLLYLVNDIRIKIDLIVSKK
jgi:hypothetical protein